jgi:hypothetical protein
MAPDGRDKMAKSFRFKNLMVNIVPEEGAEAKAELADLCLATKWCRIPTMGCLMPSVACPRFISACQYPSYCVFGTPCAFGTCGLPSVCPFGTHDMCPAPSRPDLTVTPFTPQETYTPYQAMPADAVTQARELAELKKDLKETLTAIEAQERLMEQAQQPQTLEEVRELEGELERALKEVEAVKHKLTKGK